MLQPYALFVALTVQPFPSKFSAGQRSQRLLKAGAYQGNVCLLSSNKLS